MKHISEILPDVFNTLKLQARLDYLNSKPHSCIMDEIRKEKACLIDDIFRVLKCSVPMNNEYADLISYDGCIATFDELYDKSIMDLELLLARLSAELKAWMRHNQQQSLTRKFIPLYQYKRNRFRDHGDDNN